MRQPVPARSPDRQPGRQPERSLTVVDPHAEPRCPELFKDRCRALPELLYGVLIGAHARSPCRSVPALSRDSTRRAVRIAVDLIIGIAQTCQSLTSREKPCLIQLHRGVGLLSDRAGCSIRPLDTHIHILGVLSGTDRHHEAGHVLPCPAELGTPGTRPRGQSWPRRRA